MLQAWDDITLGGLGLVSAKIERRIVGQQFPGAGADRVALADAVRVALAVAVWVDPGRVCCSVISRLLWQRAGASPMLSGSPTAKDAVGLRPHRLAAQDAALSRR